MRLPGVILAGGQSRRMDGSEKAFLDFDGQALITRTVARLSPQCEALAINANGDPSRFEALGLPVLPDEHTGHVGPLAGLSAAMTWAKSQGAEQVVTAPVDCPFLPLDLVGRLAAAGLAAVAESATGLHPVCGVWPVSAQDDIDDAIAKGARRMRRAVDITGAVSVPFAGDPDPFFNINTPDDLERGRSLLT